MNIRELRDFARVAGVGAAGLLIALGAVSLLLRPGAAGPAGNATPLEKVAPAAPNAVARPDLPPTDYLDLCRAAGL